MTGTGIAILIALGLGANAIHQSSKKKRKKKPLRPFKDSGCTELASAERVQKWFDKVAAKALEAAMKKHPLSPEMGFEEVRATVQKYVDAALATAGASCKPWSKGAERRELYKAVWCMVMTFLTSNFMVDEELGDVLELCMDPSFQPVDEDIIRQLYEETFKAWEASAPDVPGDVAYSYAAHVGPSLYYTYLTRTMPAEVNFPFVLATQSKTNGQRRVHVVPGGKWPKSMSPAEYAEQAVKLAWQNDE